MAEPLAYEGPGYEVVEEEPPEILGRNLVAASYLLASATAFFFVPEDAATAASFAHIARHLQDSREVEPEPA